ncbi:MAG: hypothetical protein KBE30_05920 [Desulfobacter sp.]|nr:hypothetical protein [Desulfobacter sp.]
MFKSIKEYLKKAGEEASKEYTIAPRRSSEENNSAIEPWIGVDLDGTLAFYDKHSSVETVGDPVPAMMTLLKDMIDKGTRVKIFTARASDPEQLPIIRKWLKIQGLPDLEITNVKDYSMVILYDDRCIQVETNTGRLIVDKSI